MPYDYSDYARDSRCSANIDDTKCDGCHYGGCCDDDPNECDGPYEESEEDSDE